MNAIISECIKKLQSLKSRLEDIKSDDERSNGVNTANSTLKQSIDTRCSLLKDMYGESDPDVIHANADYANYCMEFTDSLYEMYKELYEEAGDTPFDRGYKSQLRNFFEMLKPLQAWLEKESLSQIYNS